MNQSRFALCLGVLAQVSCCVLLVGCTTTDRDIFEFNRSGSVVGTVAEAYRENVPGFVRAGLENFSNNLAYTDVLANNLLQGKLERAATDVQRLVVNTVALGGLLDVATPLGIPRYEEDFGQTLGVWGFGPGAYFNLPFAGPTTARDIWRYPFKVLSSPLSYTQFLDPGAPASLSYISTSLGVVTFGVTRLETGKLYPEAEQMADPYAYVRACYLRDRERLVRDLPAPRPAPGTVMPKPAPPADVVRPPLPDETPADPDAAPRADLAPPAVPTAPAATDDELPPPRIRIIRRGERP
jgi:phospholipid-binding lipoprotein MlaA